MKSAVKGFAVLHPVSMVPVLGTLPADWRTPVAARPNPVVIMPSPTAADPDVSGCRASRYGLYDGGWYRRRRTNRSRSHHDRGWDRQGWNRKRYSKVDSEVNSSVYSGDSHNRQSQNCDSLFHNHYQFDAAAEQNIITRVLPICKHSFEILDIRAHYNFE